MNREPSTGTKETEAGAPGAASVDKSRIAIGWVVAGICLLAYLATGQSLPGNDATAHVHLVPRLLAHGTIYFTARDNPKMFHFAATANDSRQARIRDWNFEFQGKPAREAFDRGDIRVTRPLYYLVPTRHQGRYTNTFGLGAGLFALPVMGLASLATNLESNVELMWLLAKLAAALSVAGTVLFLFLAAMRQLGVRSAVVVALAYGLGTCAFSISSQALWQHGPCEFFVAMGAYYLLTKQAKAADFICGFGFAMAVLCRPTAGVVLACVGAHLLFSDRRRFLRFALGALPVVTLLIGYSQYTFGSLLAFGEMGVGENIALAKTGNRDMWQTPLHVGLAGVLLSPARGLFVYSPIALFSLWGAWRAFRDSVWQDLRPLVVAVVLQVLLVAKWFDWWGGWCFGYRTIVDIAILLSFLAFPVVQAVNLRPWLRAVFAALFAYSVGVQVVGAYAYDLVGWNSRMVWQVVTPDETELITFGEKASAERFVREQGGMIHPVAMDIDNPKYRGRLWSLVDSPLIHYLANFSDARAMRQNVIVRFLRDDG